MIECANSTRLGSPLDGYHLASINFCSCASVLLTIQSVRLEFITN